MKVLYWKSKGFLTTIDKETVVTVDFLEHGRGTQVVLTHERFSSKEILSGELKVVS